MKNGIQIWVQITALYSNISVCDAHTIFDSSKIQSILFFAYLDENWPQRVFFPPLHGLPFYLFIFFKMEMEHIKSLSLRKYKCTVIRDTEFWEVQD